eukprot:CAMPEP_0196253600 /NCGR_PEP_ID=MMETSP0913-20130531/52101_1 /TAXON_ID=49265 /ORGANISM="Thalassiosira rotula, Strain GSO102" /LENGTH=49 /DNA_ID= /DNA_START= /DNA_END= /DNA_ORIENTATION=
MAPGNSSKDTILALTYSLAISSNVALFRSSSSVAVDQLGSSASTPSSSS